MKTMAVSVEKKECASVAWVKGTSHAFYEDSFSLLSKDIHLVNSVGRGEVFAVFDGIGSAKLGRHSAQIMSESLITCFRNPGTILKNRESLYTHLFNVNMEIELLDMDRSGHFSDVGCVGTILWIFGDQMHVFHAGDTAAVLVIENKKTLLTSVHQAIDGAVTRYFGQGSSFKMDVQTHTIDEGDRIYLMSDGVSKVQDFAAATLSYDERPDLPSAVLMIAEQALRLGSTDDITVLGIDIEEIWD